MKKFVSALILLLMVTVSSSAMSYEQARQQALFLTDKMAYELNLNEAQYEAAYEVNLDYLMGITTPDDLYGVYWRQRNLDLSYILLDWQYSTFCAAAYFYRPLYWNAGYWRFRIYARYPHRDYFYFGHPTFVTVYRGGHSWRSNGGRSWYHGRDFRPNSGKRYFGMRDGFKRGDYGKGHKGFFGNSSKPRPALGDGRPQNGNGSFGNRGNSSVQAKPSKGSSATFGGSRSGSLSAGGLRPKDTFSPKQGTGAGLNDNDKKRPGANGAFGGGRIGNSRSGTISNSRGLISGGKNAGSYFGGSRGGSALKNSGNSMPKSRGGSFGGGSGSGSSFGGGKGASVGRSRSSAGGGSSSSGKFGGRR